MKDQQHLWKEVENGILLYMEVETVFLGLSTKTAVKIGHLEISRGYKESILYKLLPVN